MAGSNDQPWRYFTSNVTTGQQVKQAPGTLHTIIIGTAAAAGTLAVFDSLTSSGTLIASVSTASVGTFFLDVGFGTGLTTQSVSACNYVISFI